MTLMETLNEDLKKSLKQKNVITTETLRLLLSSLQYAGISAHKEKLTDDEIIAVIRKQAKQRTESIACYAQGGRMDLKEKEEKELKVLEGYLPQQLTDDALAGLVKTVIAELNPQGKKDMGKVVKAVLERAAGGADGKRVSALVGTLLT